MSSVRSVELTERALVCEFSVPYGEDFFDRAAGFIRDAEEVYKASFVRLHEHEGSCFFLGIDGRVVFRADMVGP